MIGQEILSKKLNGHPGHLWATGSWGDTGRAGEGKKGLSVGVPPPTLEQIGSDQIYARDSFLKPCIIQD